MKKIFLTLILAIFTLSISYGQEESYSGSSAAYSIRAKFSKLIIKKDYKGAIEEGIRISNVYTKWGDYKKASSMCWEMDELIKREEKETGKTDYGLRYLVGKERLRMAMNRKKTEQSRIELQQLENTIAQIKSDSLTEDWFLTQANYYQRMGMPEKSLDCYKKLMEKKSAGKDFTGTEKCYKEMIAQAKENDNPNMSAALNKIYVAWQDSIKDEKAALEYKTLQQKYDESQKILDEKNGKITANIAIIVILCIICAALACALLFCGVMVLKHIRQTKKLKKSLSIANENNEQKSKFIKNIGKQIVPVLDTIDTTSSTDIMHKNVGALKKLMTDIQTYASLEETREEHYEVEDLYINDLCERVMADAKPYIKSGIDTAVTAPRMEVKTNAEALEKILSYMLVATSQQEETEKVSLEFKKRSAHSGQLIVTNHGSILTDEEREDIFKPFTEVKDITKDNGLGYPTCDLIAYKLNGTLKLDDEFKRGTRFILELHDK